MQRLEVPPLQTKRGLGEISPGEFKQFIGDNIKLELVKLDKDISISETLEYYMGKNTQERQKFIVENLVVEEEAEINNE